MKNIPLKINTKHIFKLYQEPLRGDEHQTLLGQSFS